MTELYGDSECVFKGMVLGKGGVLFIKWSLQQSNLGLVFKGTGTRS